MEKNGIHEETMSTLWNQVYFINLVGPWFPAESCFLLGEKACHSGDLYHGILWLKQALRAIKQEDLRGGQLEEQTLDYLSFAVYMVIGLFGIRLQGQRA